MATGVQNAWSTTAASNATADTAVNWREGQAPSSVNDSVRAMMSIIKKWVKDWQGGLVTGGASTAFTLTTNEGLTLADGVKVKCRMSATSGAAPTLNVDSTGAVAIQSVQGTAVAEGALLSGGIYEFTYYSAIAAWIVSGVDILAATTAVAGKVELATVAEAGTGTDTARAVTPAGLFPAEADISSASTTNIGAAASSKVRITGTTTITAFDTVAAGLYREGRFADVLTFTHGSALLLPGAANITTAANDRFGALSLGSGNWIVLWYQKAAGSALLLASQAEAIAGTENTKSMTALRTRQSLPSRAYAEYLTNADLTTTIPLDDTIPQNTEGTEILTASITPASASHRVRVTVSGCWAWNNGAQNAVAALFQDSVADAIHAVAHFFSTTNGIVGLNFVFEYAPATTSAITIKLRVGPATAGTIRMNGNTATRIFGGVAATTMVLEEVIA